jgi:hypothetical protein
MRRSAFFGYTVLLLFLVLTAAPRAGAALDTPERFTLSIPDAYLVYAPASGDLQIAAVGNVLSYGQDWDVVMLKPYLFHIRLKTWKEFFWKVNTGRKEVYEVTGGTFGETGGSEKLKDLAMEVVGGADNSVPERFLIKFLYCYIAHFPGKNAIQITAGGNVISYGADWQTAQLKPYLYHFKQKNWKEFFWKVNTSRKMVWRTENGAFGELGGTDKELKIKVNVVN